MEFELEINRCSIKFNLLDAAAYTETLLIDRRQTVEQLKQEISLKLGVDVNELIFRRGGAHGAELSEDDLSFKQANVYNGMSIYVQKGEPTRQGWKRLRIFLAEYYNPDWKITDSLR